MTDRRSAVRRRTSAVVVALVPVAAVAVVAAACGSPDSGRTTSAAPSPTVRHSAVVADSNCRQTPPAGHIDRRAAGLRFAHGDITIAVAPVSGSSQTPPVSRCFRLPRWGNADPAVPPDSLLFAFKDSGGDGAQISFFSGALTGAAVPVGGTKLAVPPLVSPIDAQIGVSVDGVYYEAAQCSLTITAMASARGSGFFHCPTATRVSADPFHPSDTTGGDETTASPTGPDTPAQQEAASLSGWFSVTR